MTEKASTEKAATKPWWESASVALAALLVPVVVAVVGSSFSSAVTNREIDIRFVELAVDILQEEPDEESRGLRDWAIDVIDEYSGIQMSDEARESLQEDALPLSLLSSMPRSLIRRVTLVEETPVRESPGNDGEVKRVLSANTTVTPTGFSANVDGKTWHEVVYSEGLIGWITGSSIAPNP